VDAAKIEARLKSDTSHQIKAVCVVHNETSTGVISDMACRTQSNRCSQASGIADG